MARRRSPKEDDPFAALSGESSLISNPGTEGAEVEDDFSEPSPSRANVLAALAIADDAADLDIANYYVQRAIGESLLLLVDHLASRREQPVD